VLIVGLAALAISWQTTLQREKEAERLFAGAAFRVAIALYYNRSPGALHEFPKRPGDLLQGPRYSDTRRNLRRTDRDPIKTDAQWPTIAALDRGIMGVHSPIAFRPASRSNRPVPRDRDPTSMRRRRTLTGSLCICRWHYAWKRRALRRGPSAIRTRRRCSWHPA
jgi:hypothetical protein